MFCDTKSSLQDLECVDPVLQLPRVDRGPQNVVVQVPEPPDDAAQVLEPAVDRLARPIGGPDIEVSLHILTPASQRPT
jgi:hypothetical protein